MSATPILYVTGKGGSGKTTVTCGLGRALAASGARVLLVESYGHNGFSQHLKCANLSNQVTLIDENLSALRLDSRALLEAYFAKALVIPAFTTRLLSSATFNALTAAAPGVADFLALEAIESWSFSGDYEQIIVDGPATGHALQMLRAPVQLEEIAPRGPLTRPLRRIIAMLRDAKHWSVALVSLCEEMSVRECTDAHSALRELDLALERPILNRCVEKRFSKADQRACNRLKSNQPHHPLLITADRHFAAQQRVSEFAEVLKKVFNRSPLLLPDAGNHRIDHLGESLLDGLQP